MKREQSLFDKAILVNPASSFRRVWWLSIGSHLLPVIPDVFYQLGGQLATVFLTANNKLPTKSRKALADSTRSAPKKTLVKRLKLMRDFSINKRALRRVKYSVLLVGSRGDRILPSEKEVNRLSKLFASTQVVILPHSGHACLIEPQVNLYDIMRKYQLAPSLR